VCADRRAVGAADRIATIQSLIAQDPGGRGIASLVQPGHLRLAAESLLKASRVLIVSGFYIPSMGAGETDGPPGALAIGNALTSLEIEIAYATDTLNRPLFEALRMAPLFGDDPDLLERVNPTHLLSIERVGPAADGRCYNMRGEALSEGAGNFGDLFRLAVARGLPTVGIGDGGNEIGMGRVAAEVARSVPNGARIACVVPTDFLIVAGVSNWGGYGLAGALSVLAERDLLPSADQARAAVLTIWRAGAVDGRTRKAEPTVDGLELEQSLRVLEAVREAATGDSHGSPAD
jgi:hypothetical protein